MCMPSGRSGVGFRGGNGTGVGVGGHTGAVLGGDKGPKHGDVGGHGGTSGEAMAVNGMGVDASTFFALP